MNLPFEQHIWGWFIPPIYGEDLGMVDGIEFTTLVWLIVINCYLLWFLVCFFGDKWRLPGIDGNIMTIYCGKANATNDPQYDILWPHMDINGL